MPTASSNTPYLISIFESGPVLEVISEKLRENYNVNGVGFRVRNKTMIISVDGSTKYYKNVKDEVKHIAEEVLQSRNYDAYTLKVERSKSRMPDVDEETKKRSREDGKMLETIDNTLKKHDYNVLSLGIKSKPNSISLKVPDTYSKKELNEIRKLVNDIIQQKNLGKFSIKINKVNMEKRAQEQRWMPVIDTIFEGILARKEYKATGAGYSFHPLPLKIEIRTSIQSSNPHAKELGHKIERTIQNFIQSEKVEEYVKDDPYRIVVLSKDKKKIN